MTTPPPEGDGLSAWVLVSFVVAAISLVALIVFLTFEAVGGETTTSQSTVPPSEPSTSAPTTTAVESTTSTTSAPTTTSTVLDFDSLVEGLWFEETADGATNLSELVDGEFSIVDDGSSVCEREGLGSVQAVGTGSYTVAGPTVSFEFEIFCFPPEQGRTQVGDFATGNLEYDPSTDMLGELTRVDGENPMIGTWGGVDADGSEFLMRIRGSGQFDASDTSSLGCVNSGFPGPWSWNGYGSFGGNDEFSLRGTTVCFDSSGDPVTRTPLTPDGWSYRYDQASDTIVFSEDGTVLQRVTS